MHDIKRSFFHKKGFTHYADITLSIIVRQTNRIIVTNSSRRLRPGPWASREKSGYQSARAVKDYIKALLMLQYNKR